MNTPPVTPHVHTGPDVEKKSGADTADNQKKLEATHVVPFELGHYLNINPFGDSMVYTVPGNPKSEKK